jgi:hypothetical protein
MYHIDFSLIPRFPFDESAPIRARDHPDPTILMRINPLTLPATPGAACLSLTRLPTRRSRNVKSGDARNFTSINVALIINRTILLGLATLLVACHHAPHLPSRPIQQMFPRASSPPPACPGQYRNTVENYNGNFFMGCWGSKTN